ncbi:ethanolamine:proton symporter, EAT family [Clostridium pasteurianum DSM 525 = ATCC 6013]|uniref:Ethanolamine transporter n=1 Tax=Clostridium pasteurianum DSM 525 = ATCC 6013 TaxID=1262449 RepID=A0A0H3J6I7_CLOPA|nr:ethanolamine permease [Clostridium pasteurianum]AJA49059.1 ethanolamine:proton symporter, EAT family [Clostridium pasteurianum DSM 525 = ATCC 6013]AJA53047.1 ethanolamine:proton symporter, EAT family [Clostridium pasteurianum DSM 525 = ATCC 6013]AOZ76261.1 ethanolamine permease [Clostridium pasteurianum DSM 525 = ATCC 6013]AOZ80057.1 ethanolamine permease [Clostridium pasteurianum]ELP58996.1 Ethanolamin permease [Clostridium pasteurianum DSM 525 = ATCC 6013]
MVNKLKKTLSPFQLWAIIVGMVISGMYFGWNNAMSFTSPVGFIIATLIVTVFYGSFMFSYAELATAMPKADGSSEFAARTMGRFGGFFAGFSCIMEFLFATPAIAISIGAYVNFIIPSIPVTLAGLVFYAIFVAINCFGVKTAAIIETVVTVIAIIGLIIFSGASIGHVDFTRIFGGDIYKGGFSGIFNAIPFAIWFYLAAEGGAMSAEECKNPKKDIPKGFIFAVLTLMILALITFVCTAGVLDNKTLGVTNSPLPDTLNVIFGKGNILSKLMSFIGLFGLIASLHGIIIGYSRQIFAMSRSRYLPEFLSKVNSKGAPVAAIIIPSLIGMVFVLLNNTATIIVISSFGAIALHAISMVAFFLLRKKEPDMERPYKVSIALPLIALILNCIFLVTTIYSNTSTISWVIVAFVAAFIYYFIYSKLTASVSVQEEQEKAI